MNRYRAANRGFTLVEILIVVIILGILAAIVIPQFTNASTDARENSLRSMLQTLRSQVELYKLQHNDKWPTSNNQLTGGTWDWTKLTGKTDINGGTSGDTKFGPYLQDEPKNPLIAVDTDRTKMGTGASATNGWYIDANGKIKASSGNGTVPFAE